MEDVFLKIDGRRVAIPKQPNARRYRIEIDGKPFGLRWQTFRFLALLAIARISRDDGWIDGDILEHSYNSANKTAYRLRSDIKSVGWPCPLPVENDRAGCYRLNVPRDRVAVDLQQMSEFDDATVDLMLKESTDGC